MEKTPKIKQNSGKMLLYTGIIVDFLQNSTFNVLMSREPFEPKTSAQNLIFGSKGSRDIRTSKVEF